MVLGNDFAGTVASVGARLPTLKLGDRVYGMKPTSTLNVIAERNAVMAERDRKYTCLQS